jgi:putative heme degradation protein
VTLRADLDGLARLFAEGVLTEAGVRAESARLRQELAGVERRLEECGRVGALGRFVAARELAGQVWEASVLEVRRAVVAALFVVRLFPPGRGARRFDPSTVMLDPADE